MKRTATTLALLAGFGGGCTGTSTDRAAGPAPKFGAVTRPAAIPGVQGPGGEPVTMTAARGAMPTADKKAGKAGTAVVQAHLPGGYMKDDAGVVQVNGFGPGAPIPGAMPGLGSPGGILPVPGMGPPGAVAAVGAMVPPFRAPATNQRTSIQFNNPPGLNITWQLPTGGFNDPASGLTTPNVRYNFVQGQVYRLRLNHPVLLGGQPLYPTLEITPATPRTVTYLAHASVPVSFSEEDFRQAREGNLVVKVIYLPDPAFQDFAAVAGAEEIVSTRLEPGADPVAEAQRRGTILAIIRLGNIDLENKVSPAMTAPPGSGIVPVPAGPGGIVPLPGGPAVVPAPGAPLPAPTPAVPPPSGAGAAPGAASIAPPVAPGARPAAPSALPTSVRPSGR